MLIQLVKKDFLIVKKYVLIMFAVCVIFPLFLIWRSPEYAGILGFVLITIFSIFMLLQYVSLKETQYPKASTLLCALPFPRKDIVLAKYIFIFPFERIRIMCPSIVVADGTSSICAILPAVPAPVELIRISSGLTYRSGGTFFFRVSCNLESP